LKKRSKKLLFLGCGLPRGSCGEIKVFCFFSSEKKILSYLIDGGMSNLVRCAWASGDTVMAAYPDTEWGVPVHDSRGRPTGMV